MPTPARNAHAIACLVLAGLPFAAMAQDGSGAVADARDATRQAADQAEQTAPRASAPAEPLPPTPAPAAVPPRPGLTAGFSIEEALRGAGVTLPAPTALPEGAFLTKRPGFVAAGPAGTFVFIPAAEGRRPGEGAMVVAPNVKLERLAASLAEGESAAPFIVTGEVLLYRGQNHLLLSAFARGSSRPRPVEPQHTAPTAPTADGEQPPPSPVSIALDPTIAEIIADLEQRRAAPADGADADDRFRQLDRTDPAARAAPAAEAELIPEGRYITQRRARLERAPDGRWLVNFDNDADNDADTATATTAADAEATAELAPMVVIPCALLERMEVTAEFFGDAATIVVSGRVFTYDSENYLRPMIYVAERLSGVNPMQ